MCNRRTTTGGVVVSVYAIDYTKVREDKVSRQGFGSSSPLPEPKKTTRFWFEARWLADPSDPQGVSGQGFGSENFADMCRSFVTLSPKFPVSPMPLILMLGPTEKQIEDAKHSVDGNGVARPLTGPEQEQFLRYIREHRPE